MRRREVRRINLKQQEEDKRKAFNEKLYFHRSDEIIFNLRSNGMFMEVQTFLILLIFIIVSTSQIVQTASLITLLFQLFNFKYAIKLANPQQLETHHYYISENTKKAKKIQEGLKSLKRNVKMLNTMQPILLATCIVLVILSIWGVL